jgi:hypothetical protein
MVLIHATVQVHPMRSLYIAFFLQPLFVCIAGVGRPLAHGVWIHSLGRVKGVGYPRLGETCRPVTQEKFLSRSANSYQFWGGSYLSPERATFRNPANQEHSVFDDTSSTTTVLWYNFVQSHGFGARYQSYHFVAWHTSTAIS